MRVWESSTAINRRAIVCMHINVCTAYVHAYAFACLVYCCQL